MLTVGKMSRQIVVDEDDVRSLLKAVICAKAAVEVAENLLNKILSGRTSSSSRGEDHAQ